MGEEMKSKKQLLADLQAGLDSGVLTEAEVGSLVPTAQPNTTTARVEPGRTSEKLSAVDVMFYISGIVLFATIMSLIVQSWNDANLFIHILLSAFLGASMWAIAYHLIDNSPHDDLRRGLTNALLLTGSLLVVVGGYLISSTLVDGFAEAGYILTAVTLLVVGGLHIGFDRLIKRDLILLIGVFWAVASFPTLLLGILQDAQSPLSVWAIIVIISSGILAYATRVVAKMNPGRGKIHDAFDSFGAFLALVAMYIASYGDAGVVWLVILIAAVFGIFYLSIVLQNKHLLGNGSFFMVLTIITIAFRYFSGFGVPFSLTIATLGLLGSAAIASSINKKYFKKTT